MDITAAKQALRFFRIYDTKLYNEIIVMIEQNHSFLESIYFSYDYSRNSYYCPKKILSALEQLRLDQGLQKLHNYKKVPLEGNMQALAFPHRYLQILLSQGLIAAKANESVIVIFKESDLIFFSGFFEEISGDFYHFEDKKDRYALSKSLTLLQIQTIDSVFGTDFSNKFVKNIPKKGKKRFNLPQLFKSLLRRVRLSPAGA